MNKGIDTKKVLSYCPKGIVTHFGCILFLLRSKSFICDDVRVCVMLALLYIYSSVHVVYVVLLPLFVCLARLCILSLVILCRYVLLTVCL